jgi:medium-chain acyl-[acyl-carrier-protein] hydrolase
MIEAGRYLFAIKTSELDFRKRIPPSVLYRCLQESAENHAVAYAFDSETLLEKGLSWVLLKIHLVVDEYPEGRQDVIVETWPSALESRYAHRDFQVFLPGRPDPIARAASTWVLLDVARNRPSVVGNLLGEGHVVRRPRALQDPFPAITPAGDAVRTITVPVRLADLDINDHVNNLHYVEWIVESVPESVWRETTPSEMQIEFKRAVRYGESARVETLGVGGGVYTHRITSSGTSGDVVLARTRWKAPSAAV